MLRGFLLTSSVDSQAWFPPPQQDLGNFFNFYVRSKRKNGIIGNKCAKTERERERY